MENVIKCESIAHTDWSAASKNLINKLVTRESERRVYFSNKKTLKSIKVNNFELTMFYADFIIKTP